MQKPQFLLIGISGVYNYGCEAIVRGTEILLHQRWPDAGIVYASLRPDDDRRRLAGLDVEVVRRQLCGRYSPRNVARKLLSLAGVEWSPRMDHLRMVAGKDAVLSIGGDLYTLWPDGRYPKPLMNFGDAVLRGGKPYVLWGGSVGPFTKTPKIEKTVGAHLQRVSLISAREQATVDYLRSLEVTGNVVACADPAFAVAPHIQHQPRSGSPSTIGLNLSPLSVRHSHLDMESTIRQQAQGVKTLVEESGCNVKLIPHVICDFYEGDDDLRYLTRLREALPPSLQQQVELLDGELGFIGTKEELAKCDLVIAARMHCAIGALSAAVPTMLVSYSKKTIGMARYMYGHEDWVMRLPEFGSADMAHRVRTMLKDRRIISSHLKDRIPEVQADARRAMDPLARLLDRVA